VGSTTKLTVAYENNPTVGDISVVQLYFWNAGDKPIHSQDVLEPLKLVLDPGAQILETSVLRQSRGSIVDFHVSPDLSQDGKRTNTASMSFRILEKRDGAAIQLVYSGGPDVPLRVTGSIEGAQITQLQDVGAARVGPSGRFFTRRSLFLKLEFVMAITLIFSLFASRVFETILAGQSPWTAVKSGLQSLVSRGRVVVLGSFLLASAFYYFSLLNFRTVPQVLLTR
jgi:hypothetical protein